MLKIYQSANLMIKTHLGNKKIYFSQMPAVRTGVRAYSAQKRMGGETPTRLFARCVMRRETVSRALEVATVQKMAAKEV